jgi:hypothetical protein
MSFFEPLPEPPRERPSPPQPPWAGPPTNELGAAAPISVLLAHNERYAVGIESATPFSTGAELRLVVRRRRPDESSPVIRAATGDAATVSV